MKTIVSVLSGLVIFLILSFKIAKGTDTTNLNPIGWIDFETGVNCLHFTNKPGFYELPRTNVGVIEGKQFIYKISDDNFWLCVNSNGQYWIFNNQSWTNYKIPSLKRNR